MDAFDKFMLFIGVIGNFFIYFQAYSFWEQRATLTWDEKGSRTRIISYIYSMTIASIWVAYAVYISSWGIIISSGEVVVGCSLCLLIINYYSWKNKYRLSTIAQV